MRTLSNSLSNLGSVDDIRSSIRFIDPQTPEKAKQDIEYLEFSLGQEKKVRYRTSVVKMIQAKINSINKKFQPYLRK
jgi:hypothetical protein